ncbi:MAG: hypothetical protein NC078_07615 [Ruminococcus sp.]|nr:hypothetical protein [Ruminococcus sp.]
MRKTGFFTIVTAFLAIIFGGVNAYADIIVEPDYADEFYSLHSAECEYDPTVRDYKATGEFFVYASPENSKAIRHITEGDILSTNTFYTDKDGVKWAYDYNYSDSIDDYSGWYVFENVEVIYDNISFIDEHENEFIEYQGQLDKYVPQKQIVFYQYPNSEKISDIFTKKWWYPENPYYTPETVHDSASYVYIDESGNEWVNFGYIGGWVNVSDPENGGNDEQEVEGETTVTETVTDDLSDIYITDTDVPEIPEIPAPPTPSDPETEKPNFLLPIILAAAAVAAAIGFLVGTKRGKSKK